MGAIAAVGPPPQPPHHQHRVLRRSLHHHQIDMRLKHVSIVLFYALIAFLALYNPIFHVNTHVPGNTPVDYFHFHWNYWWIRHALTTPDLNVYLTNYVMAPFTSNLAYHTMAAFWFPIWALLEPLFGTLVAMTGIFVLAFTLTGYIFYLLLRREGVSTGLALIGGVMLEITPIMFTAVAFTNVNLLGWFWLPALLLLWGHIVRLNQTASLPKILLWAVILGITLWAMILTDLQYPLFAAFLIVPYGLLTLWRSSFSTSLKSGRALRTRLNRENTSLPLSVYGEGVGGRGRPLYLLFCALIALTIALILLWFIGPIPYILQFSAEGLAFTAPDQAVALDFPSGYLWHNAAGTLIGYLVIPELLLALALSLWLRKDISNPNRWFWLALVPLPLLLAAGASINIGSAEIPMPYLLLHRLLGGMFRYPERFIPVFLIPAVLFTMLTLTPLLKHYPKAKIAIPAVLLLLVIGWSRMLAPLLIQPVITPYTFYETMGQEPYDYVVVEVPTAGASGQGIVGDPHWIATEFYGLTHGKRMVNGHISRVNTWQFMYMRDSDPMMSWLGQRRPLDAAAVEAQMRERIYSYPIGYFVIHQDFIGRNTSAPQEIIGYFNALEDLVCPFAVEGDAIVYRTVWHPDGCPSRTPPQSEPKTYRIDIGTSGDERYIGWGWHWAEALPGLTLRWTGNYPQTQLYVDLPPGEYELSLMAQSFHEARQLTVLMNDTPLATPVTITPDGMQAYTFTLPAELIGDGYHISLTLNYDAALTPAEVGIGTDPRPLAIAIDWLQFTRH